MKFSQNNKIVFNISIQVRVLDSVCFHSTTLHVDQNPLGRKYYLLQHD